MTTGTLDRRHAMLLVGGIALIVVLRFVVFSDKQPVVVEATDSVPMAERRLAKLRQIVATVPAKQETAKRVHDELAAKEKGMILADTAPQAQASLLEIVRRAGKDEGVDIRGAEEMKVKPLTDDYAEVLVAVSFNCRIEQFVNMMAALANRPELIATNEVRVGAANPKEKTVSVRLALTGLAPHKLAPKKAQVAF